jgi:tetratricopeptide (TPR) repeat protein
MKESLIILLVLLSNLAYSQKDRDQIAFEGEKAYLKLEDSPDIRNYTEIIARDSLNAESYFNRAKGYYSIWRKGNNRDTIVFRHFKNDLFKANMLDSSNCNYNSWIANRCSLPDSISIIYNNKAIKNCSNTEEYFFQRSFCLMRLRRFEDAIKDLNKAKSLRQIKGDKVACKFMTEEYITHRGLCYAKMGEFKKAERDLRKVIESDTLKWESYLYLGIIESMQGKYEEALKVYNDLKERAPFFIVNYIYIGNLYHAMGNESLASENWAFAEKNGITVEEKRKPIDTQLDFFIDNFRLGSD